MAQLYPSWIEIPVSDFERARQFYARVFGLAEIAVYDDEPDMRIGVLRPSDKSVGLPGVSIVKSALHKPGGGVQVNYHVGDYTALTAALDRAVQLGGTMSTGVIDAGDGVRYGVLQDCEGNPLALSAYEPTPADAQQ